ncbi:DUF4129 domain-containing protein [Gleimia hominis]|uniref:DUF4129 domain-containing protein n=1 Tax=Gleimia hominis TaxID=595468 RepID=UPI000C80CD36|nr:DUF4129 domain-containing protein [Gleimia hominis]WIK64335.1 DUF4129 domain-containing protein [Gleimia hominis]
MLVSTAFTPDPDEARELLERELSHAEYNTFDMLQAVFNRWLQELLTAVHLPPNEVGYTVAIIAAIIVVAVLGLIIWRIRKHRKVRGQASVEDALLDPTVSAEEYASRARAALETDPDAAVIDAFRAVVALLDRAKIMHASPGRTAGDVQRELQAHFPPLRSAATHATRAFNIASYAQTPAPRTTREDAQQILIVFDQVSAAHQRKQAPQGHSEVHRYPAPQGHSETQGRPEAQGGGNE